MKKAVMAALAAAVFISLPVMAGDDDLSPSQVVRDYFDTLVAGQAKIDQRQNPHSEARHALDICDCSRKSIENISFVESLSNKPQYQLDLDGSWQQMQMRPITFSGARFEVMPDSEKVDGDNATVMVKMTLKDKRDQTHEVKLRKTKESWSRGPVRWRIYQPATGGDDPMPPYH